MELSDLKVFKTVVETGGITAAAKRLNRVPSNVTARIQKLENELGRSLFVREKNRLHISSSGEQLLVYAQQILSLAHEAVDELQQREPNGRLRLGAMEAVAATHLASPLMCFHKAYPKVGLDLKTGPSGSLLERVLAGEQDMALVADPPDDDRLEIEPVYEETLVLVSDLAHQPIKGPQDLSAEPTLLGFGHRCRYRTILSQWLTSHATVGRVVEINSYHSLLSCVTAGMGIAVVPQSLLAVYPHSHHLQVHDLPSRWQRSSTCAIWRKDSEKNNIKAFMECLLALDNRP